MKEDKFYNVVSKPLQELKRERGFEVNIFCREGFIQILFFIDTADRNIINVFTPESKKDKEYYEKARELRLEPCLSEKNIVFTEHLFDIKEKFLII
jgi:hypothetical protein